MADFNVERATCEPELNRDPIIELFSFFFKTWRLSCVLRSLHASIPRTEFPCSFNFGENNAMPHIPGTTARIHLQ